ncbi:hypothetical protein [Bacillus sp. FJAT-27225]|uniref:hypothetical protein n=1 Tax=Bacillus sp. FJAT-27225 TaxID=1743144 RepID=UPI00158676C9|nr:hypothetical protein [Bacillus sp. FJAT-27225]
MKRRSLYIGFCMLMAVAFALAGCSGNKAILDDQGREVSFDNKDKPSLVFFFTGNT